MKTNPAIASEVQAITEAPASPRPAHTPGPWEVGGKVGLYCDDVQITSNKEPLAIAVPRRSYDIMSLARRSPAELAANARLIASAPTLLDALAGCADALREAGKDFAQANRLAARPNLYELHEQAARAAIAKARG